MRKIYIYGLVAIAPCFLVLRAEAQLTVTTPGLTPGLCVQSTGTSTIADAPCLGRDKIISVTTSPFSLGNSDCGAVIAPGALLTTNPDIILPNSPPANCEFTFATTQIGFYIDFNSQFARLPGTVGNVTQWTIPVVSAFRTDNASISIQYNGTNWMQSNASSSIYQTTVQPNNSAQFAHGQVYFKWNGAASRFELCPKNGPGGLIVDGTMRQVPFDCLTLVQSATTSSNTNFFYATHTAGDVLSVSGATVSMSTGKIHLSFTSSVLGNVSDQVGISCHSIGGSIQANVNDTGAIVSSTGIDLLNTSPTGLGTYTSGGICSIMRLAAGTTGHTTFDDGVEVKSDDTHYTLVGMASIGASHAVNDSSTKRDVASRFNRRLKTCINSYSADRTWTNTSAWGEPSSEIRCEFVTFDDTNENVKSWSITGIFGNNTVGDGTLVTAGFDSTTPEIETAGQKGNNIALGVHGSKSGLSEGLHYTLLAKTLGGGTSTIYGATPATSLEAQVWQ